MDKRENEKEGRLFLKQLMITAWKEIEKRKEYFSGEIPDGYFLLKGLHHSYLCKVKNTEKMRGGRIYYEMYVEDYFPKDKEPHKSHIGERQNISLLKGDTRKIIKVLSH